MQIVRNSSERPNQKSVECPELEKLGLFHICYPENNNVSISF